MQVPLRLACNSTIWNPTPAEWLLAGKYIQPEEREKISKFHYKNDAKLSLLGRLLLRYAITVYTGIEWKRLCMVRDTKGKPLLAHQHEISISFNASHQGDYVVVAADSVRVGVDVMDARERHGDTEKFFKLMKRHFTNDEWREIYSQDNPNTQMEAFYRHWCLKESFVKAIGTGISYSLLSLNFVTKTSLSSTCLVTDTILYDKKKHASNWSFEESLLGNNHIVAVARNSNTQLSLPLFKEMSFKDLMSRGEPLAADDYIDKLFTDSYHNPYKPNRSKDVMTD